MAINSGKKKLKTPSPPRMRSGKRVKRLGGQRVETRSVDGRPTDISTATDLIIKKRYRDPSWSGWSFTSDIEFDSPVDIDELIDAATDKHQ